MRCVIVSNIALVSEYAYLLTERLKLGQSKCVKSGVPFFREKFLTLRNFISTCVCFILLNDYILFLSC